MKRRMLACLLCLAIWAPTVGGLAEEAAQPPAAAVTVQQKTPEPAPEKKPEAERETAAPTAAPTTAPTAAPTAVHTAAPTATHTAAPTATHTAAPTATHTAAPTDTHTAAPTATHTAAPTVAPTDDGAGEATVAPSAEVTSVPSAEPTEGVTEEPSPEPSPVPEETEELCVQVKASRASAFEGDGVSASVSVSGGLPPYSVEMTVEIGGACIGERIVELSEAGSTSIRATAIYGTATFRARVKDALGNTIGDSARTRIAKHDPESRAQWEASLRSVELSGDWREDLLAVAHSQLGYRESKCDFIIDDEGKLKGYTRYGHWYGVKYCDWCAMFVSFCLNYAGISRSDCPWDAGCEVCRRNLKHGGAYERAGDYVPEPGDLVFIERGTPGQANHIGIVKQVSGSTLITIEGNSGNMVREVSRSLKDGNILGYGNLTVLMQQAEERKAASSAQDEQPEEAESSAQDEQPEEAESPAQGEQPEQGAFPAPGEGTAQETQPAEAATPEQSGGKPREATSSALDEQPAEAESPALDAQPAEAQS